MSIPEQWIQPIRPKTPNELMQERCAMLEAQRDEAEERWQEAQALCAEYARDFGVLLRERDELITKCAALEDAHTRLFEELLCLRRTKQPLLREDD